MTLSTTKEPFEHHCAALDYAEANDLILVWEGTAAFEKRRRHVPPDQFEVRPCITRKGITNCGLFPKAIEIAEWEADAARRDKLAAKRARRMAKMLERDAQERRRSGEAGK
jgi:hypothetical protein